MLARDSFSLGSKCCVTEVIPHNWINMAATNYGMVLFFSDYPKAIRRGELALKSNHLAVFKFDNRMCQFLAKVTKLGDISAINRRICNHPGQHAKMAAS